MSQSPPIKRTTVEEVKKLARLKMAWRILTFFFVIFSILLIVLWADGISTLKSYIITIVFLLSAMYYLYKTKNPEPLFLFFGITGSLIAQISIWNVENVSHYANFIWITICVVIAFMSGKYKGPLVLLIFNIIGIAYFFFFRHNDILTKFTPYSNLRLTSEVVEIMVSFSILGYLMIQFQQFQKLWEKTYQEMNATLETNMLIIKNQNVENITLLKEIHHRVKNNLQIIISLLRLQKAELNSEEARLNFEEAINRIMVISSIHEKLYKQENLSELKLKTYLEDLVEDIKAVYDIDNKIETEIICTIPKINEKTIVPVGLLVNELVSNSLKHAFKEKQAGKIRLELTPEADNFKILYKDDGIWEDCSKEDGFGLELIRIFTEQLNGTYSLKKNESGSFYTFQLSVQKD